MGVILAGDVGGTKAALALFRAGPGEALAPLREETFESGAHASLRELLARFLAGQGAPDAACLAVAGPVEGGAVSLTNVRWSLDRAGLAEVAGVPPGRARLVNDLAAAAYGMPHLPDDRFEVLQQGEPPDGLAGLAVVSPGTGLGEAYLHFDGERHHPVASEAGHADFAPNSDEELELWRFLRRRHGGHVSWERVLSGDGLRAVHDCLREREGLGRPAAPPQGPDPNAEIARRALAGEDAVSARALALWVAVLGAEAGNAALRWLPDGGVVLGGGIVPKILPALRAKGFRAAFRAKGRFAGRMGRFPVRACLEPRVTLLGAAHLAVSRLAGAGASAERDRHDE